ncbi:MAG: Cysteine desulfurase NifS [Candidatus Anoxychlamydiales bacterium]|nr:Cysteine desulfurase NifS [Candidatus Anoxychlamydiales bacterium]NGX36175.1 Cysteine desulfurase NifS [Candidatus Anoxychlamydiales bacterium]
MNQKIYLDNNATTGLDVEVLVVLKNELYPSNPSSAHFFGRRAKKELEKARSNIASFLKVEPSSLIFTSGGTEAVNLALQSLLDLILQEEDSPHIIASDIDHPSVHNLLNNNLKKKKHLFTNIQVGLYGAIKPEQIEEAITENTRLIILSAVNSETGVKTDIDSIAKIAQKKGIYLFVDGVALLGKELFTIASGISAMSFSSHKIHGPNGVGLCYFKNINKLSPLFFGGPQEFEKRPGTENIAGILGFAKAVEILQKSLNEKTSQIFKLRTYFERSLINEIKDTSINGTGPRACNTTNICFKGVDGESLLILLDQKGVLASHGSACSSGSRSPSRVLLNMGIDPKDARSSIRFSLSRFTTQEEIDTALKIIKEIVIKLRS